MIEEIDADGSGTVDWEGTIKKYLSVMHIFMFDWYFCFRIQISDDRLKRKHKTLTIIGYFNVDFLILCKYNC